MDPALDYKYDIFVSYKRHPETLKWIRDHFLPLLDLRVGLELGRDPLIYVCEITDQIQAGTAWPIQLGEELGNSRILIALWSGIYLNSDWCARELCLMLARERKAKCRTSQNKYGLVIPVVVHDGDKIPQELGLTQRLEIQTCYNTRMHKESTKAEQLSEKIAKHAMGFVQSINNAPKWKKKWPTQAAEKLFEAYYAPEVSQRSVPRFKANE